MVQTGRIIYYSTYTSIQPFVDYTKEKQMHPLLKKLSIWNPVEFRYDFPMYDFNEETEELRIPAGVPSTLLARTLLNNPKNPVQYEVHVDQTPPQFHAPQARIFAEPRKNVQVAALDFLRTDRCPQRFLSLNTGDGKTFCTVYYAVRSGQVPAIFVSSLKLLDQWKEKILEYTDLTEDQILLVADGSIDKIDWSKNYQFLLFSHRTVGRYMDQPQSNLEQLLRRLGYTMKVFDEAHLEMSSIARIDRETKAPSLYVTATPKRSNPAEDELYSRIYSTAPKFTSQNKTIVERDENYHNVVICKFSSEPDMDFLLAFQKVSRLRGFNVAKYSEYILEEKLDSYADVIFQLLYHVVLNQGQTTRKTVILVKNIKLLEALRTTIKERLEEKDIHLELTRFHSKVPALEKEHALEGNLIFSTDSSLSTAIDIPDLEAMLSLIPTSSEPLTAQMLGRLRNNGKPVFYFDLVDTGFKECLKQLSKRKTSVYRKKAKTLKEIDL